MWGAMLFCSSSLACVFHLLTFVDLGNDIYDAVLYRVYSVYVSFADLCFYDCD